MSTQENEAVFGRLFGGNGADHRRRPNEFTDHTLGANKPSEAAKRQAVGLLPERGSTTLSPMSKKGHCSEDAWKGSLEFPAHGNRSQSPHRTDSIRSQDSSTGSATTTRSSTFPNTMSDSLGSLYTTPESPTFDVGSQCSYGNDSNMTSGNTSPNPSRKNTIDERLDDFVLEGIEVKRAKTEHYGTSAASTQMATDVLAHFPTHSKSFPLTDTYLVNETWPELVHMQAGMDFQWKNIAPRRPTPGFLALTPDERSMVSRVDPLPKVGSANLPFRPMKSLDPVSDPVPGEDCSQDKHATADVSSRSPCSSSNTPATPTPAPLSMRNTPSPPPEAEGPVRSIAVRQLVACDSYGDAYYDVLCQAIHNLILEHTPTAVLEDLEKPMKMTAAWCTEQAINMIQEKLYDISCAEKIAADCGENSLDDSGSGSQAPSHAAVASATQKKHARAKRHGESSNRRGDDDSEDDTNNNQDQEDNSTGRQDDRHLSKRDRVGFSCPFRKRNPLRFNIRDWSNCALQPFANITLLKRHIKSCHGLKQSSEYVCRRCKQDMGRGESLDQHLNLPRQSLCESVIEEPVANPEDGITRDIDEQLCARDNVRKVDSWVALWRTLFPNDEHPPSQGKCGSFRDSLYRPPLSEIPWADMILEFDPPVGLEEVVNKFDSQEKGLLPTGEGWPPLRAKLHTRFHAIYYQGLDPGDSSSLANDVCQEYISETLKACAKIPDEKGPYVDGPLRNSPSRPIATPVRSLKKSGKTATSRQIEPLATPALLPRSVPVSFVPNQPPINAVNWLPSPPRPPFPNMGDGPFPGRQNPIAGGYLNTFPTNVQSRPPSVSDSTISSGSTRQPQPLHSSVAPHVEPGHAARALAYGPVFAYPAENDSFGVPSYAFANAPPFSPSGPGYTNLPPAPNRLQVHTTEFAQPQNDAEGPILDTVMPGFGDCNDPWQG
ncbi:hypothetical protein PpBr36_03058 [Pyricularia pennisetigena]|uniref:hypothetical protein n=1 Tax=Pyricularia pennisetigena TaxID=1578925 RepID=UPI00114F9E6B|nr:hypothetical protein PpBr36_03058 [Pyricularia pennisetigena]TLS29992.1 hypothetical protein PpBr36_03058 [Pyricularia pennisetigena]